LPTQVLKDNLHYSLTMPGLSSKIKERLAEKKHEFKEKINPLSSTNKKARQERRSERIEEQKVEREAYRKERQHQIAARGKYKAQREYAPPSKGRGSSIRRSAGPTFVPVRATDPFGVFQPRRPKPRAAPTKTTTVRTGDKTITIREHNTEEQKKKRSGWEFKDPFDLD
jgi:hypothetical protein